MNPRALLTFGRRVADTQETGDIVDVGADALREAFMADVAIVVLWGDGSRPEVSCSGQFPDPFVGPVDSTTYRLADLERLLTSEDMAHQRSAVLGSDGDHCSFLLLGWRTPDGNVQNEDDAGVELAADLLRVAMTQAELKDRLEASRQSRVELEEQLAGAGHLYMLGELASGVSHDFNNTLTTILGTTEWLLRNAVLEDEAREDLTHIRMAATDAAAYAHRLQLAARQIPAYSGRLSQVPGDTCTPTQAYRTEVVDLSSIAKHMRALSRPRWAHVTGRGVPLEFVVNAPPVALVSGRAPEIRELLLNLVFNAVDAMEDTGGRLTLSVRQVDGKVSLSVSDQGAGIADDVRPRIFEPFFTTKGKNGSGLGLSMCWRIAHQHGGTLEVESRANEGTTFTLTLPAAASDETSLQEAPMDSERQTQRVLLIDDQPDVRESVSDMLKALGHNVSVAADGRTALQLVQNGTFDVVLTDLRMPGMDGLDLAKRLRALRPDVPVVLLTGWGTFFENSEPEAIAVVLPKPPTLHSLSEAITRAATDVAA